MPLAKRGQSHPAGSLAPLSGARKARASGTRRYHRHQTHVIWRGTRCYVNPVLCKEVQTHSASTFSGMPQHGIITWACKFKYA